MASRRGVLTFVGLVLVVAGCSSSGSSQNKASVTTTTLQHDSPNGSLLSFREVLGQVPYGKSSDAPSTTCGGGRLITAPIPNHQVVLPDLTKTSCYVLGPTILTGNHISTATAVVNTTSAGWQIDVHFDTNDFVTKVATPYVERQVAIVIGGVVESAPTINAGIDSPDVTISGSFDHATAVRVAASIAPPDKAVEAASNSPKTTTTPVTVPAEFKQRCAIVATRLGYGSVAATMTMIPVELLRPVFARAHEPFPAALARAGNPHDIALCALAPKHTTTNPTTTMCPNGNPVIELFGNLNALVMYAVDARLTATRLPDRRYFLPPGVTEPTNPSGCAGS